jgi:hypothetical protein
VVPARTPPSADGGSVAVATIAAKNYLSYARVLARSLAAKHPEVTLVTLLTDEIEGCFDADAEPFRVLPVAKVGIPGLHALRFRYDRKELAVAAKPFLLERLLDRGFGAALFFDPDILVLSDLTSLFADVRRHAVSLVPHLLAPLAGPAAIARELTILQSGTFNAGCVGVSETTGARAFLRWWQQRVLAHCRHEVPAGVYYDQRWLDLAPVFFDDVFSVRESTYNIAHWNLPERHVETDGEALSVDGRPCRFFHFSGFDPDRPEAVTRYSARLTLNDIGPAAALFRRYAVMLDAAGYQSTKGWPYAYGRFDNGVAVTPRMRALYAELADSAADFGDPLRTAAPDSFWRWLVRAGEVDGRPARAPALKRMPRS